MSEEKKKPPRSQIFRYFRYEIRNNNLDFELGRTRGRSKIFSRGWISKKLSKILAIFILCRSDLGRPNFEKTG